MKLASLTLASVFLVTRTQAATLARDCCTTTALRVFTRHVNAQAADLEAVGRAVLPLADGVGDGRIGLPRAPTVIASKVSLLMFLRARRCSMRGR